MRGVFYFGTAGKGGDLYAVDAKSGEVIFKFKTSDMEHFALVDGQILLANRKNKPVLISAKDGLLLKEIEFEKFSLSADQIMLVSGGRLYAVQMTEPRCAQFARKFSFGEIYRQSCNEINLSLLFISFYRLYDDLF